MIASDPLVESVDLPAAQASPGSQSTELPTVSPTYPGRSLSTWRQLVFVATVSTAMFTNLLGFGNTVATVDLISKSFGNIDSNPGKVAWLIAGYSLTIGTFILMAGRLGDVFGYRLLFILGMGWFALWSLVAGLSVYEAPSEVLFVFARVMQGLGPALTLPNGLALLGRAYGPDDPRRNMSFAWFGFTAPSGALAGFVFGGLFADLAWWPWMYWSQAIALAGIAVASFWAIPASISGQGEERERQHTDKGGRDSKGQRRSLRELSAILDLRGAATGVAALVLFNFAWNQAVVVGWQKPYVYVCLILGFVLGVLFFLVESCWATHPLLPLDALNADIGFVAVCTGTGWACFGIWVFYILRVAIEIDGNTPLQMAAWVSPIIPSGLVSTMAVGLLVNKIRASWIMLVGQVAFVVGSILAATRPPGSVYWTYYFFSVLITTVGMDTSFPAATILFSKAVAHEYQGMGASLIMTVVNYSISLGLGFAGTIETHINRGGHTEADRLLGYRGALWFSVGLAGLGLFLSLVFLFRDYRRANIARVL